MNAAENHNCSVCRLWPVAAAMLGACLIFGALIWAMRHYTKPEPLGQARAVERAEKLTELHAEETEKLDHIGWIDQSKGVVRLPIEVAMQIVEREWQNHAVGRSNLIARVEKATAVPPKPAAKPNPFE